MRQDTVPSVLTWPHHGGMGPWEGGKQHADTHWLMPVFVYTYVSPLMSKRRLVGHNVDVCVFEKNAFSRIQLSAYHCLLVTQWLCLSLQCSHTTSFFPFCPCVCVFVCRLPEGKIRHELWKQALQLFYPADSWVEQLPFQRWQRGRGRCRDRVKYRFQTKLDTFSHLSCLQRLFIQRGGCLLISPYSVSLHDHPTLC